MNGWILYRPAVAHPNVLYVQIFSTAPVQTTTTSRIILYPECRREFFELKTLLKKIFYAASLTLLGGLDSEGLTGISVLPNGICNNLYFYLEWNRSS